MINKRHSNENAGGSTRITIDGNVTIGDVNGQFAIGENITQTQSISVTDLNDLRTGLLDFQNGLAKLDFSAKNKDIVKGDMSSAIKEAKKSKPVLSKIKDRFENIINTINETGTAIKGISELYEPAKKIAKLVGISVSFLV